MSAHKPKLPLAEEAITLSKGSLWRKMPLIAGLIGIVALGITISMGSKDHSFVYFGSYMVSFLFFLTIALGGLFFVLIHFAAKAGWSTVIRRLAEAVMGTIPLFALLTIPLLIGGEHNGLHTLFHHWMDKAAVAKDPILQGKSAYLNTGFFFARAIFYFGFWILCSQWYLRNSIKQDTVGGEAITRKLQFWSPMGIMFFALSVTFAGFDWVMSIDPHWYSTIFGVYIFAGCVVSLHATVALITIALRSSGYLKNVVTVEHDQDVGKMIFAFTVFWSYIAFSQFMLIWYANIPEETKWFQYRLFGEWQPLTIALALGHFVVPFFFLMSRHIKRNPVTLAFGALWMLTFHLVDLYWLIMPTLYHHGHKHFHKQDLVFLGLSFVGIGALFFAGFTWWLGRSSLVPKQDPRLPESLSFENM
ncbi:MAG: hypothetical protein EP343_07895 [Deltaproteobacteria bacterium]|nr:MAG: hypothetical protein EP343_07895 [Deltaproteobacteria bacterium]